MTAVGPLPPGGIKGINKIDIPDKNDDKNWDKTIGVIEQILAKGLEVEIGSLTLHAEGEGTNWKVYDQNGNVVDEEELRNRLDSCCGTPPPSPVTKKNLQMLLAGVAMSVKTDEHGRVSIEEIQKLAANDGKALGKEEVVAKVQSTADKTFIKRNRAVDASYNLLAKGAHIQVGGVTYKKGAKPGQVIKVKAGSETPVTRENFEREVAAQAAAGQPLDGKGPKLAEAAAALTETDVTTGAAKDKVVAVEKLAEAAAASGATLDKTLLDRSGVLINLPSAAAAAPAPAPAASPPPVPPPPKPLDVTFISNASGISMNVVQGGGKPNVVIRVDDGLSDSEEKQLEDAGLLKLYRQVIAGEDPAGKVLPMDEGKVRLWKKRMEILVGMEKKYAEALGSTEDEVTLQNKIVKRLAAAATHGDIVWKNPKELAKAYMDKIPDGDKVGGMVKARYVLDHAPALIKGDVTKFVLKQTRARAAASLVDQTLAPEDLEALLLEVFHFAHAQVSEHVPTGVVLVNYRSIGITTTTTDDEFAAAMLGRPTGSGASASTGTSGSGGTAGPNPDVETENPDLRTALQAIYDIEHIDAVAAKRSVTKRESFKRRPLGQTPDGRLTYIKDSNPDYTTAIPLLERVAADIGAKPSDRSTAYMELLDIFGEQAEKAPDEDVRAGILGKLIVTITGAEAFVSAESSAGRSASITGLRANYLRLRVMAAQMYAKAYVELGEPALKAGAMAAIDGVPRDFEFRVEKGSVRADQVKRQLMLQLRMDPRISRALREQPVREGRDGKPADNSAAFNAEYDAQIGLLVAVIGDTQASAADRARAKYYHGMYVVARFKDRLGDADPAVKMKGVGILDGAATDLKEAIAQLDAVITSPPSGMGADEVDELRDLRKQVYSQVAQLALTFNGQLGALDTRPSASLKSENDAAETFAKAPATRPKNLPAKANVGNARDLYKGMAVAVAKILPKGIQLEGFVDPGPENKFKGQPLTPDRFGILMARSNKPDAFNPNKEGKSRGASDAGGEGGRASEGEDGSGGGGGSGGSDGPGGG